MANSKPNAILLGGPDCGKKIVKKVRAMMLKDGSIYEATTERDSEGLIIFRHSWKGVCQ